jgi:hypothetical protein
MARWPLHWCVWLSKLTFVPGDRTVMPCSCHDTASAHAETVKPEHLSTASFRSAEFWSGRAEEARTILAEITDALDNRAMLEIVVQYELLAAHARRLSAPHPFDRVIREPPEGRVMSNDQVNRIPDVGESLSVLLEKAARYRRHDQTFARDPIGEHLINCSNALEGLVRETLKRGWAENAGEKVARGAACDQ